MPRVSMSPVSLPVLQMWTRSLALSVPITSPRTIISGASISARTRAFGPTVRIPLSMRILLRTRHPGTNHHDRRFYRSSSIITPSARALSWEFGLIIGRVSRSLLSLCLGAAHSQEYSGCFLGGSRSTKRESLPVQVVSGLEHESAYHATAVIQQKDAL
jgi:hypothetical protein